ncbi:MAG: glycoside hydrolase family 65 protein, partial [Bacteroidota bacterium]
MKFRFLLLLSVTFYSLFSQNANSPWHITADNIDPNNYYGITVANGMVGMVSSPEPLKVGDVVLNGVYDYYQRGRVSNILKTFSHMNMHLEVDKRRIK